MQLMVLWLGCQRSSSSKLVAFKLASTKSKLLKILFLNVVSFSIAIHKLNVIDFEETRSCHKKRKGATK